ncbi:hypothetical protein OGAPHI_002570 [Ogataea philodendri]|uniref:Uncharacterized protein n=1 Tax=Ogataea philodendri TaxID=1378263 RepID=A0A9P8PC25_9ASCO|nr:uncharacterized protein OGAPHI_002570 [Ogataea philodendri]KAH3668815.1 hypothetical protein OGAPHI_002570 [Ogataea philodendri]
MKFVAQNTVGIDVFVVKTEPILVFDGILVVCIFVPSFNHERFPELVGGENQIKLRIGGAQVDPIFCVQILGDQVPHLNRKSVPGNNGLPESISARMQPTDHTSIAVVYSWNVSMISGARYHLVATYSVMNPKLSSWEATERASPKSQILRSQLEFSSKFEGLRSLWSTLAECNAFNARSV